MRGVTIDEEQNDLVEQWLSLVDEEDTLPELEADQRNRALEAVTLQALADGGEGRQELLTAFRTTGNATLRERLEQIVLPPSTLAVYEPDEYRTHPEVRFDEFRMPIRAALGLPVADMLKAEPGFQQDPFKWTASWFAGRPAVARSTADKWSVPRRADGTALTHVVQVDLETEAGNQGSDIYPAIGLPSTGVIQFFHDLETYGDSSDDPTAWRVVWLPESIRELTLADVGLFTNVTELVSINAQVMATAPSVLNLDGLSEDEGDRYQRAAELIEEVAGAFSSAAPEGWVSIRVEIPSITEVTGFTAVATMDDGSSVSFYIADDEGEENTLDSNPAHSLRCCASTTRW